MDVVFFLILLSAILGCAWVRPPSPGLFTRLFCFFFVCLVTFNYTSLCFGSSRENVSPRALTKHCCCHGHFYLSVYGPQLMSFDRSRIAVGATRHAQTQLVNKASLVKFVKSRKTLAWESKGKVFLNYKQWPKISRNRHHSPSKARAHPAPSDVSNFWEVSLECRVSLPGRDPRKFFPTGPVGKRAGESYARGGTDEGRNKLVRSTHKGISALVEFRTGPVVKLKMPLFRNAPDWRTSRAI